MTPIDSSRRLGPKMWQLRTTGTVLGLIAIFTHLLLLTAEGSWVLCIASDGHFELELQGAECCRAMPASQSHEAGQDGSAVEDACDDCIDLPFGSPRSVIAARKSSVRTFLAAPAVAHASLAVQLLQVRCDVAQALPAAPHPCPCGLASTVLLC